MNSTIEKFGYPENLIAQYDHWVVLFREKQLSAGCLVLACTEEADSLSRISQEAFTELKRVTTDIEVNLARLVRFDRINFILLMMVDPHVHFHVIPRHQEERVLAGVTFVDASWPRPPDFGGSVAIDAQQSDSVRRLLAESWTKEG